MEIKTFDECFTKHTKTRGEINPIKVKLSGKEYKRGSFWNVGTYVQLWNGDKRGSLYAMPANWLIEFVKDSMIRVEYDTIDFSIGIRDTVAILRANYNQIIGSREVCQIDPSTIPAGWEY